MNIIKIKIILFFLLFININQYLYCSTASNQNFKTNPPWFNSFENEHALTKYYFITKNKIIKKNILEIQLVLYSYLKKGDRNEIVKFWKYTNNKFSPLFHDYTQDKGLDYQYFPDKCKNCKKVKNIYKLFLWAKSDIPENLKEKKLVLMPFIDKLAKRDGMDKFQLKDISIVYFKKHIPPIKYENVCDHFFYDKDGFAYVQYFQSNNKECADKLPDSIVNSANEASTNYYKVSDNDIQDNTVDPLYENKNEINGRPSKNLDKKNYESENISEVKVGQLIDTVSTSIINKQKAEKVKNKANDISPKNLDKNRKKILPSDDNKQTPEKIPEPKFSLPIGDKIYYYDDKYGYINYNNDLVTHSPGYFENLDNIIITNISYDLSRVSSYSPIRLSIKEKKYQFNKSDNRDLTIVWKKDTNSFVPVAMKNKAHLKYFDKIKIVNLDEITAYNTADKAHNDFNKVDTNFIRKHGITTTKWHDFNNILQIFINYKNSKIEEDKQLNWYYEKNKTGNRIIIGQNQLYLENTDQNWSLKKINHQAIYFFFPEPKEPSSIETYILYPDWNEVIKYRKTVILNKPNQYVYQIIANNFVDESIYIDETFKYDKLKIKQLGYWAIFDNFLDSDSELLTKRYQDYKTSKEFMDLLKNAMATHKIFRMDSFQGTGSRKLDHNNINLGKEFPSAAEIQYAIPLLNKHDKAYNNVMWELHIFLSRSFTTQLEEAQITPIFEKLSELNVIRIVIWEFAHNKPDELTDFQNVFRNAERFSIKYKHTVIYKNECKNLISIPYSNKNNETCIQ